MTHQYTISGMTCGNCIAKLKSELLKSGDILSADVQLNSPQATITMSRHITTDTLQQIISKAGAFTIKDAENVSSLHKAEDASNANNSYFPIFLIFAYITGTSLLVQALQDKFSWMQWMTHFMAGFFLVFSFFKLMNLTGFAEGYKTYDVLAKKMPVWGFVYPFVELSLAIVLLLGFAPLAVNLIVLLVMGLSSVGVIQSLLKNSPFQCACLGTVIKLPLSKVTLFEDLLMVAMSMVMLVKMLA